MRKISSNVAKINTKSSRNVALHLNKESKTSPNYPKCDHSSEFKVLPVSCYCLLIQILCGPVEFEKLWLYCIFRNLKPMFEQKLCHGVQNVFQDASGIICEIKHFKTVNHGV